MKIKDYVVYRDSDDMSLSLATILIRDSINQSKLPLPSVEGARITGVKVRIESDTFNIVAVYLSPNKVVDVKGLITVLSNIPKLILAGDVNAKHPMWGSNIIDQRGKELAEALSELSLTVLNDGSPTFMRKYSSGLVESHLDVVAVPDDIAQNCRLEIEPVAMLSDHCRCYLQVFSRWRRWRTVKVTNWKLYRRLVSTGLKESSDICELMKSCFHKATRKVRVPSNMASPDHKLAGLLEAVENARRRFRKHGHLSDYSEYES